MSQHPVHGTPVPFGPWATISFGVIMLVSSTFVGLWLLSILYMIFEPGTLDLTAIAQNGLTSDRAQFWLRLTCLSGLVGCMMVYYLVRVRQGDLVEDYLGIKPFSLSLLAPWLGATLVCAAIGLVLAGLMGGEEPTDTSNQLAVLDISFMAVVVFAVAKPMWEELLFRGFVFSGLRNSSLGAQGAVILPAFWWAGTNLITNLGFLIGLLLFGVLLGYARERHGSILLTIIMHGTYGLVLLFMQSYWV